MIKTSYILRPDSSSSSPSSPLPPFSTLHPFAFPITLRELEACDYFDLKLTAITAMAVHNILVIGGNFGGIGAAHYLLKHTIPTLESNEKSTKYKVILVTPSTHFFWKIGAPRTLVSADLVPISKVFAPIHDAFKDYPSDRFELVLGSATGLDEGRKHVTIKSLAPSSATLLSYSTLIIATGTTSASPLWTLHGSHEESIAAFKTLHQSLPEASTIFIVGGGPVGTETAGRFSIAHSHGQY